MSDQISNIYGANPIKESVASINTKNSKKIGIKFPLKFKNGTFLKKSSGTDLIIGALRQLLLTRQGERVMLPDYGTSIWKYLMEPVDQLLLNNIKDEIFNTITKYAKDVIILKIQIFFIENSIRIGLFCKLAYDDSVKFEFTENII